MTREEREQLIAKLQSENAETLADIAEREACNPDLINAETDAFLQRMQQRRELVEKEAPRSGLIFKTTQTPPPAKMSDVDSAAWNSWIRGHLLAEREVIAYATGSVMRKKDAAIRKQTETEIGALVARIDDLESRVVELEARMEQSNGNGYAG